MEESGEEFKEIWKKSDWSNILSLYSIQETVFSGT